MRNAALVRPLRTLIAGLLAIGLAGCKDPAGPTPTSIVLSPTSVSLDAVGATAQLTAEVRDQDNQPMPDQPITWSTNNSGVATVDSTGRVTAVGNGSAGITATAGGASAGATVTVAQAVVTLTKVGGDAQTDTVAQTLPESLVVRALDRLGQPVASQTISFAVVLGSGSVDPAGATTDADGRASTTWTLGTTAGTDHRVNATHPAVGTPAAFTATALADAAESVEKVQGDAQTGAVSTPLADSIVVRVVDQFGNGVSAQPVLFQPVAGSGSASPSSINSDAGGRAATEWTVGADVGEDSLVVTVGALAAVTFTATVNDPVPTNIAIHDGDGQTGLVGFAVNIPPAVLVTDQFGDPSPGVDVTFTVTGGGGTVDGALTTIVQTDADGIAAVGDWTLGTVPGTNTLDATATGVGSVSFTATGAAAAYDIEVRYLTSVTTSQEQAFIDAEAKWEILIFGDLPNITVNIPANQCFDGQPAVNETIDDLIIFAILDSIDGPGGVLGQAGPCFIRNSNDLPLLGLMHFDTADVANLEGANLFDEVILHEMGHVIGLGTLWPLFGLLEGAGTSDPYFTGTRAIEAFDRIGGASYTGNKVPVENTGGAGTRDGHWRESILDNELMTGFLDTGVENPLSEVTTASFWDMGYLVNLDGSDDFTIVLSLMAGPPGPTLQLVDDIARLPIYVVDSGGRVVRVIPAR